MDETRTDVTYRPARRIAGKGSADHQFREELRGIAIDGDDAVYAVGDSAVKVFDADGKLSRQWTTRLPGFSIAVGSDGRVWVGQWQQVEIYDGEARLADTWRDPERLGLITAIGLRGDDVFLADATARCIRRFDRQGGFRNNIGDRHRKGGFHIPNGVVDFGIDREGILHVANPGMHRVEHYRADGELLGHFGRFDGRDPAGFPGCCNPTNVTLDGADRVIVSEKAGPRAKLYSPEGRLLAVIADAGFDPNAKNMDVAVDSQGRIYVVDTATLEIHVFAPVGREAG
jgi:sugar lactone lactonase YvrE